MAPLLQVSELQTHYFSFGGARIVKAVDGIDFTVNEGETIGLVGESGCGKTTTCLSVVGLLPPAARIVGGSIEFAGEELTQKSSRELRRIRGRQIAMILQDPMASLNPLFSEAIGSCRIIAILLPRMRRNSPLTFASACSPANFMLPPTNCQYCGGGNRQPTNTSLSSRDPTRRPARSSRPFIHGKVDPIDGFDDAGPAKRKVMGLQFRYSISGAILVFPLGLQYFAVADPGAPAAIAKELRAPAPRAECRGLESRKPPVADHQHRPAVKTASIPRYADAEEAEELPR